jgi:hypothetical protein
MLSWEEREESEDAISEEREKEKRKMKETRLGRDFLRHNPARLWSGDSSCKP